MAQYNTPQALRPLEKLIGNFAYTNGYEPMSVFNDFLRYVIHGFSPGAPPIKDWKYKRQQNRIFMELLTEWIQLMQRELQTHEWYDAFGDLFMAIFTDLQQYRFSNHQISSYNRRNRNGLTFLIEIH